MKVVEDEVSRLEALCRATTKGWVHAGGRQVNFRPGGTEHYPFKTTEDAAFIVAANTALPAALAEVKQLLAALAALADAVGHHGDCTPQNCTCHPLLRAGRKMGEP